jgi:hypothetical protein
VVSDASEFVLVRGVVYRLLDLSPRPLSNPKPKYYRRSVPPDYAPTNWRSKWPAAYLPHRLPEHEVIDEARAREVMNAGLAHLRQPAKETAR